MKISQRDNSNIPKVYAYVGNPYHENMPYPTNWLVPENSDPHKFAPFGDAFQSRKCPECKVKLLREKGDDRKMDVSNYTCPECNSRYSIRQMMGREYGPLAMNPATLNWDSGSNTNNEAGGVFYHSEPYANQDTFSGNLGS